MSLDYDSIDTVSCQLFQKFYAYIYSQRLSGHLLRPITLEYCYHSGVAYAKDNGKADNRDNLVYNLFSTNYRFICSNTIRNKGYEENCDNFIYSKIQLVTDVICGMTDSYALDVYKMLVTHV